MPYMVGLALLSIIVTIFGLSTQRPPSTSERLYRTFSEKPSAYLSAIRAKAARR
jgi:hypothetical protein